MNREYSETKKYGNGFNIRLKFSLRNNEAQ